MPASLLQRCTTLHRLALRNNPIRMQQMRELEGFEAFAARRKDKLDKVVDSRVDIDLAEAADYDKG